MAPREVKDEESQGEGNVSTHVYAMYPNGVQVSLNLTQNPTS